VLSVFHRMVVTSAGAAACAAAACVDVAVAVHFW